MRLFDLFHFFSDRIGGRNLFNGDACKSNETTVQSTTNRTILHYISSRDTPSAEMIVEYWHGMNSYIQSFRFKRISVKG